MKCKLIFKQSIINSIAFVLYYGYGLDTNGYFNC